MFFLELENDMQGCEFYLYCIRCKEDNEARFKKGERTMEERIGDVTLMVLVMTWLLGIVLLCLSLM